MPAFEAPKRVLLVQLSLVTIRSGFNDIPIYKIMISRYSWLRGPDSLALPQNEVHVWRAALNSDPIDLERLRATLSADERTRAARFQFPKDQQHFVAARGTLRMILARYLDRAPDRFEFCYNPFGKPELAPGGDTGGLRFNLSHSQGLALYALTRDQEIGVDLEGVRADFEWEDIASRSFSPAEVEALRLVPAALRAEAFFNCWTRKEAFVKARGEGLSLPLDQFEVSVAPGEPARLLRTAGDLQEASQWSIRELEPAPGYSAAVAVRAPSWEFKLWELCGFRAPIIS
jgi:4'-phosphopantetheinyl transferase